MHEHWNLDITEQFVFNDKVLQQIVPYPTLYTVHYDEIIYICFTATKISFVQCSMMVQTNSLVEKGAASPGV